MKKQNQKHVLVIDDDQDILEAIKDVFQLFDIPVLTASNGEEGLQIFQSHQANIPLIILDMQMPVMNGAETLRELRALDPQVHVILSSASYNREAHHNLPINNFLPKPYSIDSIMALVKPIYQSNVH